MPTSKSISLEELVSLAKRRGFVYQASEIYGGLAGFWDYGPLGTELVNNLKQSWWRRFVYERIDVVGIDSAIIQNPKLWQASGHVDEFVDPMVDCKNCKHRFRADHLAGVDTTDLDVLAKGIVGKACPNCDKKDTLTAPRQFNMMFKTYVGPVEDQSSVAYLRPETAGGIFTNYKNVLDTMRVKVPFGIAQIGKSFRNEITPSEFIFRVRELEIMELEYFSRAEDAVKLFDEFLQIQKDWLAQIGLDPKHIHSYEHPLEARAHYSKRTVDLEYDFPFGTKEITGIAYRTDYDLKSHAEASGKDLSYFDEVTAERFLPHVVEPTFGVGRIALALICAAYHEEEVKGEKRIVLKFKPELAPVKLAVLPLSKNEKLTPLAKEVWQTLAGNYATEYDETQSIGRRYRRQDEIGTPLCITVDFESLEDKCVTVRHRDTMKQERVPIKDIQVIVGQLLESF